MRDRYGLVVTVEHISGINNRSETGRIIIWRAGTSPFPPFLSLLLLPTLLPMSPQCLFRQRTDLRVRTQVNSFHALTDAALWSYGHGNEDPKTERQKVFLSVTLTVTPFHFYLRTAQVTVRPGSHSSLYALTSDLAWTSTLYVSHLPIL